ncbi:hypothetical protein L3081_24375 [Colwellia sp. MSW7]|uniref:Uncharacterized protein n=1 Tax=Colwellia maritima TaxID=2912588 RepID=A0ABS9X6U8_9GAMM|nr:hypothetical protein [Colwellia maritima]MCI2285966.1 hypothetical protein [Colwellia maritima]
MEQGFEFGKNLSERLAKQSCETFPQVPNNMDQPKADWNDVYVQKGAAGFDTIFNKEISVNTGVEINV